MLETQAFVIPVEEIFGSIPALSIATMRLYNKSPPKLSSFQQQQCIISPKSMDHLDGSANWAWFADLARDAHVSVVSW